MYSLTTHSSLKFLIIISYLSCPDIFIFFEQKSNNFHSFDKPYMVYLWIFNIRFSTPSFEILTIVVWTSLIIQNPTNFRKYALVGCLSTIKEQRRIEVYKCKDETNTAAELKLNEMKTARTTILKQKSKKRKFIPWHNRILWWWNQSKSFYWVPLSFSVSRSMYGIYYAVLPLFSTRPNQYIHVRTVWMYVFIVAYTHFMHQNINM